MAATVAVPVLPCTRSEMFDLLSFVAGQAVALRAMLQRGPATALEVHLCANMLFATGLAYDRIKQELGK